MWMRRASSPDGCARPSSLERAERDDERERVLSVRVHEDERAEALGTPLDSGSVGVAGGHLPSQTLPTPSRVAPSTPLRALHGGKGRLQVRVAAAAALPQV